MALRIEDELVQIRPVFLYKGIDLNKWARVHPRFENHDGCIVDLGCLGWNKDPNIIDSDNWTDYFIDKKRIIGVDPQEDNKPNTELCRCFLSNFSGRANLISSGPSAKIQENPNGEFDVLTWLDFKTKYNIGPISILKINIEGSEWDLIESFTSEDLYDIDQICVSFHDFLDELKHLHYRTSSCIIKLLENNYHVIDLGIYGWKTFIKKTR